jgi:hypothetical protein
MSKKALTDRDAFVALKEECSETRYRYETLRHKQKNGYEATEEEKTFIKTIREKGRLLWNERTQVAYNRLFKNK